MSADPGCGPGPPFLRPESVAVSHDGASVFVVYRTGTEDGSILAEFARTSTEGAIGYLGCLARARADCARSRGVHGFERVTISVDGRYLYLGGLTGLGIFRT